MDKNKIVDILMNLSFVSGDKPHAQMTLTRLGCEQIADVLEQDKFCDCKEKPVRFHSFCRNCGKEIRLKDTPTVQEMLEQCENKPELPEEILKQDYQGQHREIKDKINAIIRYLKAREG